MFKATITLQGNTIGDLELAMEEVSRNIREGFTSGHNRNESGRYQFAIEGEEEVSTEEG